MASLFTENQNTNYFIDHMTWKRMIIATLNPSLSITILVKLFNTRHDDHDDGHCHFEPIEQALLLCSFFLKFQYSIVVTFGFVSFQS